MAELLHTCKRRNSLPVFAIAVITAALVFCGIWRSLDSHHEVPPTPGVITHSTPVGGQVEDGVFRSLPERDLGLIRSQI